MRLQEGEINCISMLLNCRNHCGGLRGSLKRRRGGVLHALHVLHGQYSHGEKAMKKALMMVACAAAFAAAKKPYHFSLSADGKTLYLTAENRGFVLSFR